ncbi:MAG: hypothetical protein CFE24_10290 [Flavobacterium sp. BFFFF2]|nr:MAG: hypothetical protein CFE24_10290 [Flavobacterium sp. BFFFF2]
MMMWEFDTLKILDVNKKASQVYGYTKDEFTQLNIKQIRPEEDIPLIEDATKNLESYGVEHKRVWRHLKKNGALMFVEVIAHVFELNGKLVSITHMQDVTESLKAEEKLRLSDYIIQKTTTAIYLVRSDGSIYDFNEAAYTMLGYTKEEFAMLHQMDLDPTLNLTKIAEGFEELRREGTASFLAKIVKKSGALIDVEITSSFIDYDGIKLKCSFVTDITEKKNVEIKLIENEIYLRSILDNEPECVKVLNVKGELLSMNPAGLAMIEADNEQQVLGHRMTDLVNKKYQLGFNRLSKEVFKGNAGTFEFEMTSLKGSQRWLETHAVPLKDSTGEIVKLLGVTRDITDRKKAEDDKKQLTNRLLLATKSAQLGIWEWDLESKTVFFDQGMCRIYGMSENEFKADYDRWITRLHDEDREKIDNEIQLAITNKKDYHTEFRIVWDDHSIHYIRASGIVENVDGKPKRMIGVNWDVTKEKEKVQHLKLLESVIINSKDSILITEAEPFDKPGPKILFVNPAFTLMTGYTPEEVIGKTPRILQNEDTEREELDKLRVAMKNWESAEITVSNTRKNGEKFWNNFSMTPVADEKGWFTHWIAVERDVTKDKETALEKERMMKELLENNLELKQFSYITTHNLRAPLTNLILICKLLNPEKIEDPSTLQLIEAFKTSTDQLNDTLNDLINVLIVKEKTDLKLEELSFEEILTKVKESISETMSNSKAVIEADFSAMQTVPFTKIYLESIFLNLITNSIRYRHPDRPPIIKIKTTIDAAGITKLIFSDNGIGMDMSRVKNKIFGFHQRFHNNADSKGIGLFLIKSQINALKGDIEVDSQLNIGTTFKIIFKKAIK